VERGQERRQCRRSVPCGEGHHQHHTERVTSKKFTPYPSSATWRGLTVFWVVAPSSLIEICWCIRGAMMGAVSTSETSVSFYKTSWCDNPEDSHHTHPCDNLESHLSATFCKEPSNFRQRRSRQQVTPNQLWGVFASKIHRVILKFQLIRMVLYFRDHLQTVVKLTPVYTLYSC
jgi:hypothetical protein